MKHLNVKEIHEIKAAGGAFTTSDIVAITATIGTVGAAFMVGMYSVRADACKNHPTYTENEKLICVWENNQKVRMWGEVGIFTSVTFAAAGVIIHNQNIRLIAT